VRSEQRRGLSLYVCRMSPCSMLASNGITISQFGSDEIDRRQGEIAFDKREIIAAASVQPPPPRRS
jgi:hypothetical protein